ncbi:MATE family efflux transporter [Pelagibaculum spongiae]|uniref:MATE family efflux transporter n=1 Tax=Pelagibaculum spongiae TaxID=2080658 RepID=A0A2V1GZ35_9GAMM|nr:MATE family efflux transporter [Pelagibaculum spongiae]PVZ70647.1 MATE family efflux transporter [Pelagibaculum spongiae]
MTQPRFVQGSTMRHVIAMSMSGAMGLTTLFLVDMLDLFFLSLLGEDFLAAAVGYASTILFLTTSISIGLSIATTATVSRALGERNRGKANRLMINAVALAIIVSCLVALVTWLMIPQLLSWVGAQGEVHRLAESYLKIIIPSMPLLALAMSFGAGLRAVGDAKLSMNSSLAGGAVNAMLDPVFIFAFSMGIEGAAIASVLARLTMMLVSAYGVVVKHGLIGRFIPAHFQRDLPFILKVALPAMATNLATPISSAFVTRSIAEYGDGFVAGYAIVGRLIPVSFGVVFALSGAIGPIIGQNFGANLMPRVRQSLKDAYLFSGIYIVSVSILLLLLQDQIAGLFNAQGNAAQLVQFFCSYIAISFLFNAFLFVSNAAFNNLGKATWSTGLNWARATLGTIPFVVIGSQMAGAYGVLAGQAIGGIIFAIIAMVLAMRHITSLENKLAEVPMVVKAPLLEEQQEAAEQESLPCTLNPQSSDSAQLCQLAEEAEFEGELRAEKLAQERVG